jgi:DNA primase
MAEGLSVNVAILKGGKDPDEILKKSGQEFFSNLLKAAPTYMEYLLNKEKDNLDIFSMEGKIAYARIATAHLSKVSDPLERELYIKNISTELNISEELIRGEYKKVSAQNKKLEEKKQETKENYKRKNESSEDKLKNNLDVCEGELINILVNNVSWFKRLSKHLTGGFFSFEEYNHIVKVLDELVSERGNYDVNIIMDRLEGKEKSKIAMLKVKSLNYEVNDKTVSELIKRIKYLKNQVTRALNILQKHSDDNYADFSDLIDPNFE